MECLRWPNCEQNLTRPVKGLLNREFLLRLSVKKFFDYPKVAFKAEKELGNYGILLKIKELLWSDPIKILKNSLLIFFIK
jgi:hypothetical protein